MEKYTASPNLAATTLALLILADLLPLLSDEPTERVDAFHDDDRQPEVAAFRHRRLRP
ncbi:hypothetical protein [Hymenobacter amundsenii]|uniref:hypothetical protein n=1 Tax=Hymenobacter amundsenii TaxID=2006685 RepID=UPI0013FE1E7B|nr:hypothetical protein [Hymenobacter amundsenii]